jgi:hypothetical protein
MRFETEKVNAIRSATKSAAVCSHTTGTNGMHEEGRQLERDIDRYW